MVATLANKKTWLAKAADGCRLQMAAWTTEAPVGDLRVRGRARTPCGRFDATQGEHTTGRRAVVVCAPNRTNSHPSPYPPTECERNGITGNTHVCARYRYWPCEI